MDKPTGEQIKEVHDCSNCNFRKDVAPYSVLLGCKLDNKTHLQPYTCDKWAFWEVKEKSNE